MKKIIIATSLLLTVHFTVNAQRWDRRNDRHEDNYDNRVIYRGDENKRGYDGDERKDYGRDERKDYDRRGNYYRDDSREYYREQPRVVYHRDYYQPQRMTYYYYPSANVYYNAFNHLYTYPCRGEWVNASALPYGFYVNEPYREVYCNEDENIIAYNNAHMNAFKTYVDARHHAPTQFRIGIRF